MVKNGTVIKLNQYSRIKYWAVNNVMELIRSFEKIIFLKNLYYPGRVIFMRTLRKEDKNKTFSQG